LAADAYQTQARLDGRLVIVGFGTVAQAALPLLLRHVALDRNRITIFSADSTGRSIAEACGVTDFRHEPLTAANFRRTLSPLLAETSFLLNLSVDVSSVALVELCRDRGALYLDSCIEPWAGGYVDPKLIPEDRTNYALRARALAVDQRPGGSAANPRPTAVLTHGVNPGLVSHFTKCALLEMARKVGRDDRAPATRDGWAQLAMQLEVRAIHVAERDWQVAGRPKQRGEFVNTWSVDGFVGEGCQPAELGWGTHEKRLPAGASEHAHGCRAGIFLDRPGLAVRVRSFTPLAGPYHGFLVTHAEAISIADYLTVFDGELPVYRPTVHYAYRPCDDALLSIDEFNGTEFEAQPKYRLLRDEIVSGIDELGVLLGGNPAGAFWYGSRLAIAEARRLAPYNNATTLQTAAGVLGGVIWAIENDGRGVVEPEAMDFERVMAIARPYLGEMVGVWTDWTPLVGRSRLFAEELDRDDPWQFENVVVR
jgi:homospermidine synthase